MQRRGPGLLGQNPGYGGAARAMQGGDGLLGRAPGNARPQQQRSQVGAAYYRGGITGQQQLQHTALLEQPDVYGTDVYAEQTEEELYYGAGAKEVGYLEEQGNIVEKQREYLQEPLYEVEQAGYREDDTYGDNVQQFDYHHGHLSQAQQNRQFRQPRSVIEQPPVSRAGLMEQPRVRRAEDDLYAQIEERKLLEQHRQAQARDLMAETDYERQPRSLLQAPREERGGVLDRPSSRGSQRKPLIPDIQPPVMPLALMEDTWESVEEPSSQFERGLNQLRNDRGLVEVPGHTAREYPQREERGAVRREPRRQMGASVQQGDRREHQRGLLERPQDRQGLMDTPVEQRALMEKARSLLDAPGGKQSHEQRGLLKAPGENRGQNQRGLLNAPGENRGQNQRGLLNAPGENRGRDQRGLLNVPGENRGRDQRGLFNVPEENRGRDQRGLLNVTREQRGLMDHSREKSLLGTPREGRGLMDSPHERQGQREVLRGGRGLLENPQEGVLASRQAVARQGQQMQPAGNRKAALLSSPGRQRGGNKLRQNKRNRNHDERNSEKDLQMELMEKAGLQLRLLEEQQQQEEMERMTLLQQQQAILMQQQQQQHLQQVQQQQQMQQFQQQQLYQQQQQAKLLLSQEKQGKIPSILDMEVKSTLGKRRGGLSIPADNKRPRLRQEDRKRRNEPSRGTNFLERKKRQRERNKELTRNRDTRSPPSKKRDRRDSGVSRNANRRSTPKKENRDMKESKGDTKEGMKGSSRDARVDIKDTKGEKGKTDAKPMTTVVIEILDDGDEKYDPAKPTPDISPPKEIASKVDVKPTIKYKKEEKKSEGKTEEKKDEAKKDTKEEPKMEEGNEERKTEDKDGKQKEISLTVTVNKKGRSVADGDKEGSLSPVKPKKYRCNVCSVECYDEESFARHMNGKKHREKMQLVMTSTSHQALLIKTRMQAEEHLRQIENKKGSSSDSKGKTLETHCKICDRMYTGAYKDHKSTPGHKAREDRSKAGCKICNVTTFNTFIDFTKHLQSDWHRKNKLQLKSEEEDDDLADLVTLDTIGFEEDSSGGQMDKNEMVTEKEGPALTKTAQETEQNHAKEVSTSTPKASVKPPKLDITPVRSSEEETIPEKYDPKVAVGQKYVVQVSGYFCKLCSKFYISETSAKVTHCQSQAHYDKLKKVLASKSSSKTEVKDDKTKPASETGKPPAKSAADSTENLAKVSKTSPAKSVASKQEVKNQSTLNSENKVANQTADEHKDSIVTQKSEAAKEIFTSSINEGGEQKSMETDQGGDKKSEKRKQEDDEKERHVDNDEEDTIEDGGEQNSREMERRAEDEKSEIEEQGDEEKSQEEEIEDDAIEEKKYDRGRHTPGKSPRGKYQKAIRGGVGRGRRGRKN